MQAIRCDNQVVIHKLTDDPQLKDNIYCERSYCTPDSHYFVFQRHSGPVDGYPWKTHVEYIACEFGTWRMHSLGRGISYPDVNHRGRMFHLHPRDDGYELVRVDIATGQSAVIPIDGSVKPITGMSVSQDERYLAYGIELGYDPQMFGVELVDLHTGCKRIVFRDPEICNPHPEFEPSQGEVVLIQQNRGCQFKADGSAVRWSADPGATLLTVAPDDGAMTPLPIGKPHTPPITGHQQWIGKTRSVLLTTAPATSPGQNAGLVCVGLNGERRTVNDTLNSHVHASRCGRFFCCDRVYTGEILIGSIATGEARLVCVSSPRTRDLVDRFGQMADAHAYLSPDLRWMVYQSCESGSPQIHVAAIPPAMIDELAPRAPQS